MNAIVKAAEYLDSRDGRAIGGQAVIARYLDVTPQAVSGVANGRRPLPKAWVNPLIRLTNGHVTPLDCLQDLCQPHSSGAKKRKRHKRRSDEKGG